MPGEEFWVNVVSRQSKGWGKYKYGETEQSYNGPWAYEIVVRWPPHGKTIHEVVWGGMIHLPLGLNQYRTIFLNFMFLSWYTEKA